MSVDRVVVVAAWISSKDLDVDACCDSSTLLTLTEGAGRTDVRRVDEKVEISSATAFVRADVDSWVSLIPRDIERKSLDCSFARLLAWLSTARCQRFVRTACVELTIRSRSPQPAAEPVDDLDMLSCLHNRLLAIPLQSTSQTARDVLQCSTSGFTPSRRRLSAHVQLLSVLAGPLGAFRVYLLADLSKSLHLDGSGLVRGLDLCNGFGP